MSQLPLRRLLISNFRKLSGSWDLPLDAPIVLIHGPNGTGKTSILSGLEFALTGEVRSMRRMDPRYTAFLPHRGSSFATLSVELENADGEVSSSEPITVGGDEIKGSPALGAEEAQFYSERAFLDQTSLGQLLDLYQYSEGNQESSLARFVNELLGLDHLDSLRSGLDDATDVRRLRRLSPSYADAEDELRRDSDSLSSKTQELESVEGERSATIAQIRDLAAASGYEAELRDDGEFDADELQRFISREAFDGEVTRAEERARTLTELKGRLRGLRSRPSVDRIEVVRSEVSDATAAVARWRDAHGEAIDELRAELAARGDLGGNARNSLVAELRALEGRLEKHESASTLAESAVARLNDLRSQVEAIDVAIAQAETDAGSMAVALAAIRDRIVGDICPICDRDYSELSQGHLLAHVEQKIAALAGQGRELQELRTRREELGTELAAAEREVSELREATLSESQLAETGSQRDLVAGLLERFDAVLPEIDRGRALNQAATDAADRLVELEAAAQEKQAIVGELQEHASGLGMDGPQGGDSLEESLDALTEVAASRLESLRHRAASLTALADRLDRYRSLGERRDVLMGDIAVAARAKALVEARLAEANRRREVARSIHSAAADVRTAIVQRVFTQSLNDVWREVFSRLAPSEPFVPAFGIPTATRTALELRLETHHRAGGTAGTPSLMLSAGNLNTAALSLFIALHLAVEPLVPCLVFDDPVQSMDEVHVSQFAGLLRVLSKRHGRQVVAAVHERELFEYLALELSPAFEGDQLLTVELGLGPDGAAAPTVTRMTWSEDTAVAG